MESNRWITTVTSIWIQCTSGSSYAFGIYSPILKSSQNYTQSTLDTISVFKDIGANAGILSGVLYADVAFNRGNRSSSSFSRVSNFGGPWVVHLAGAIQCFAGYLLMWLSVVGVMKQPEVPLMCLFMFTASHGQTFFNTANVVTAVQNFPDYGGTIVGIMKGCLGLSGAILIQVYQTLFNNQPSTFLLMLAILPSLVSILLMCSVRIHDKTTQNDIKHLKRLSTIVVLLALYLMIIIISQNVFALPTWTHIVTLVILLVLLISPLKISIEAQKENMAKSISEKNPLLDNPRECLEPEKISPPEENVIKNLNLFQAMRTLNFWLLFIAMSCGMGSGLATINNISQIGESLNYTKIERNTLVSLWSIWNFFGRFGAGYLSDILFHKKGTARPFLMAITLGTMSMGHVIIGSGFVGNLYIGSVLIGICYGSQWSLMPTITSEIYGVQHMGTIFNTIAIASPIGSYLLSVRITGYFYDKEAEKTGNYCYGTHCFMISFFIMACVTMFASFVAFVLFLRTRRFYKDVLVRRLKHMT